MHQGRLMLLLGLSDWRPALRRPAARRRRIGGRLVSLEMGEDPLDDLRFLDARDHLEPPAAAPAALDIDGEDTLETLGPGHGAVTMRLGFIRRRRLPTGPWPWHHSRPQRARRYEDAVISRQMGPGLRHQRDEPGGDRASLSPPRFFVASKAAVSANAARQHHP